MISAEFDCIDVVFTRQRFELDRSRAESSGRIEKHPEHYRDEM